MEFIFLTTTGKEYILRRGSRSTKYLPWLTAHKLIESDKAAKLTIFSKENIAAMYEDITNVLISHKLGLDPESQEAIQTILKSNLFASRSTVEELAALCKKALNCSIAAEKTFPDEKYNESYWADLTQFKAGLEEMSAGTEDVYFSYNAVIV